MNQRAATREKKMLAWQKELLLTLSHHIPESSKCHTAYYPLIHIPHSPKTAYLSTILRKITFRKFIATGKGAKYNCWRREQLRDIGEPWERLGFGIATRLSHCGCLHLLQIENEGKTPRNQRTNPRNSNCRKGGKRLKILETFCRHGICQKFYTAGFSG